ncbi:hypothetical protein FRC19_005154 [Serendipita sp. 401]|nr:hypothetical protein FRC19_005154 [Serendipita sp. 401]KAG9030507.1 hypothetical protein FS842_004373 [Serendipita sp. 407]
MLRSFFVCLSFARLVDGGKEGETYLAPDSVSLIHFLPLSFTFSLTLSPFHLLLFIFSFFHFVVEIRVGFFGRGDSLESLSSPRRTLIGVKRSFQTPPPLLFFPPFSLSVLSLPVTFSLSQYLLVSFFQWSTLDLTVSFTPKNASEIC